MESRQVLAFALRFIDDWRAGAADRVRECRHSAAGARGGAAEGNCRPDIDRCGTLAPLPPTAHRKRTAIRRCGRVERRGCDLGQPHAGGIRFGRRTSEAEPCARLAHVRVCDRACYRHGHIVRRRSGAAFDAHGYEPVLKPATSGILVADKLGLRLDKSLIVAQVALALLLITTAAL